MTANKTFVILNEVKNLENVMNACKSKIIKSLLRRDDSKQNLCHSERSEESIKN
jgi:hypothetical protein